MEPVIKLIGLTRNQLGESPVWDPDLKKLFWVDSLAPAIWSLDPATGRQEVFAAPDSIGSIVLGAPGSLIAGVRNQLYRVDVAAATFTPIGEPLGFPPEERLNDGKADRVGRFVTGSMLHHGETAKLLQFDKGGVRKVLVTDIAISNSICFSPAGDHMFYADSLQRKVWRFPYDQETGALGEREVFLDTEPLGSAPDGATVDAAGRMWLALVEVAKLACVSPDGKIERLIETPIPFPSCPAFGGEGLSTLFLTSISDSGGRLFTDHRDGGRLMVIEGLDAVGIPEARCRI